MTAMTSMPDAFSVEQTIVLTCDMVQCMQALMRPCSPCEMCDVERACECVRVLVT